MKIYISLPISNCALATQYAIAQKTATQIRKLGHEPVNPFETPPPPFEMSEKEQYAHYMGRDIENLLNCDAAYFCKGWQNSNGCRVENLAAYLNGLSLYYDISNIPQLY